MANFMQIPDLSNDAVVGTLWNARVTPESYPSEELYYTHLMQQYQTILAAIEAVSNQRNSTNTFFLTLHTIFVTGIGLAIGYRSSLLLSEVQWVLLLVLIPLWILCYLWWRLIRAYRQSNANKFKIIGEFERKLPASPFWRAEWQTLIKNGSYQPVSRLEEMIPIAFALIYVFGAIAWLIL